MFEMAKAYCFSALLVRKKKKKLKKALEHREAKRKRALQAKLASLVHPADEKVSKETSIDALLPSGTGSTCDMALLGDDNLDGTEAIVEGAYQDGDEHDDVSLMIRDLSDLDLQPKAKGQGDLALEEPGTNGNIPDVKCEGCERATPQMVIQSGHASDPGVRQPASFWESPMLKRSCSNLETWAAYRLPASPTKSFSYDDLQILSGNVKGEVSQEFHASPLSVMTRCSADMVMLKKQSPSQVLPSRSRKLWWKLFLWSHRNLHKPWISIRQTNPATFNDDTNPKGEGGYSSDTLETSNAILRRSSKGKEAAVDSCRADLWPHNHWVAFPAESSSINRVHAWVNCLEDYQYSLVDGDEVYDRQEAHSIVFPNSPEIGESSGGNKQPRISWRLAEEVLQANNIVQSLNSLSSVAHISGMDLKVIPAISAFSSLRALNLSSNFIVHITPGTLPKGLHILDLSRNKIAAIEGLRELTRLRVLNLSYNRISCIGHGLSNCSHIKELYLAGNKISHIEGLHRLLKLSVLDLSFNKITTSKVLGQIVANYNSLLALNLLGNPIQGNIGDDQLRRTVTSLLPQLAYLNKQPIKAQRVREAATDNIAKAALGSNGWINRRRSVRLSSQRSSSSVRGTIREATGHRGQGGGVSGHRCSRKRSKGKYPSSVRM